MIPRRRESGAALLLAVLVLAILIALVGQMTITAAHNRSVADAALADLQNTYGVRAGYQQGLLYLEADFERGKDLDTLHELWADPISIPIPPDNKTTVWLRIQDVERKLNLSKLVGDNGEKNQEQVARLERLLRNLGHDDEIAERIVDYMDSDSQGEYETGARNKRLLNLEELLRIEGVPREVLYGDPGKELVGIMEFLTLWPATGPVAKVNVNTAPKEVLMTLHDDMTEDVATAILNYRNTLKEDGSYQDFAKTQDLREVNGVTDELYAAISSKIAVTSGHFEIHARSLTGTVEKAWLFVVERKEAKPTRIASLLENDFLWIKPPEEEP